MLECHFIHSMPYRVVPWKSPLSHTLSIPALRYLQTSLSLVKALAWQTTTTITESYYVFPSKNQPQPSVFSQEHTFMIHLIFAVGKLLTYSILYIHFPSINFPSSWFFKGRKKKPTSTGNITRTIHLSFLPSFLNDFNSFHGSVVSYHSCWCSFCQETEFSDMISLPSLRCHSHPAGFSQTGSLPLSHQRGKHGSHSSCSAPGYYSFSYLSPWFIWYSRNNTFWVTLGSSLTQITVCVEVKEREIIIRRWNLWKCRRPAIWSSISPHVLECGKLQERVTGLYQITKYFINSVLTCGCVEVIVWVVFLFFLVANYSPITVICIHLHQFICHVKFV